MGPEKAITYVTLHAKKGLMDFTENREIFSRSQCVNWSFHGVNSKFHAVFTLWWKKFHCRHETSMPWKIEWKLSCCEYSIGVTTFTPWNRLGWWKKLHTMKSYLMFFHVLRASSYEPSWPGWLGYWDEFCLGFIWEISARFPRWEKAKDLGDEFWRQIRETKQT